MLLKTAAVVPVATAPNAPGDPKRQQDSKIKAGMNFPTNDVARFQFLDRALAARLIPDH